MSVHILFADGSRQLSHNNDDLRERWELRREFQAADIIAEAERGYAVPMLDSYESLDAMIEMRGVYVTMQSALHTRRRERVDLKTYQLILSVEAELLGMQSQLRAKIKQAARADYTETLMRYAVELEGLLTDSGIDLPPAPFAAWERMRAEVQGVAS